MGKTLLRIILWMILLPVLLPIAVLWLLIMFFPLRKIAWHLQTDPTVWKSMNELCEETGYPRWMVSQAIEMFLIADRLLWRVRDELVEGLSERYQRSLRDPKRKRPTSINHQYFEYRLKYTGGNKNPWQNAWAHIGGLAQA